MKSIDSKKLAKVRIKRGFRMAKTTHCPFTHSLCVECALYRGGHHYLNLSKHDWGYTDEPKEHDSVDFHALKKFV